MISKKQGEWDRLYFSDNPTTKLVPNCIESKPDLKAIKSGTTDSREGSSFTLEEAKNYYDKNGVQRIAILGSARVFPYDNNKDKEGTDDEVEIKEFVKELDGIQEPVAEEIRDSIRELSGELKKLIATLKFDIVSDEPTGGDKKSRSINAIDSYRKDLIGHKKTLRIQRESLAKLLEDHKHLQVSIPGKIEKIENRLWGILYTTKAQNELDSFLDAMDGTGSKYTTLNGGWAGVEENSMGIPMISSLFGIVHNAEEKGLYPPITVMPSGGSYDRVTTALDGNRGEGKDIDIDKSIAVYLKNLVFDTIAKNVGRSNNEVFENAVQAEPNIKALSKKFKEELEKVFDENGRTITTEDYGDFATKLSDFLLSKGIEGNVFSGFPDLFNKSGYDMLAGKIKSTYFEIEGVWGDDSKYLVAMSTGLLVFEPYGFWTNIEIANGIAQEKSIAIIADPDKLEKYVDFDKQEFVQKEGYRVYKEACNTAKWINEEWKNKVPLQKSVTQPSWTKGSRNKNLAQKRDKNISTESKSEKPPAENPDSEPRGMTM